MRHTVLPLRIDASLGSPYHADDADADADDEDVCERTSHVLIAAFTKTTLTITDTRSDNVVRVSHVCMDACPYVPLSVSLPDNQPLEI